MAAKFRNGEHHRNPSGFYNKVKYLLRESKRNPEKLYQIFKDITYHRNIVNDGRYEESWEAAYRVAKSMIKNNADNPRDYLNSIYIHEREERKTWYEKICLK
jgi:hypothetical protein